MEPQIKASHTHVRPQTDTLWSGAVFKSYLVTENPRNMMKLSTGPWPTRSVTLAQVTATPYPMPVSKVIRELLLTLTMHVSHDMTCQG